MRSSRTWPARSWSTRPCRWCRPRWRACSCPRRLGRASRRSALGETAHVVAAFHNVAAAKLQHDEPIDCDVLIFGDDPKARAAVIGARRGGRNARRARWSARQCRGGGGLTSVLIGINRHYKVDGPASASPVSARASPLRKSCARSPRSGASRRCGRGTTSAPADRRAGASRRCAASQDVLVVTQKIVSKAEGRYRDLATWSPRRARAGSVTGKDPHLVEAILARPPRCCALHRTC